MLEEHIDEQLGGAGNTVRIASHQADGALNTWFRQLSRTQDVMVGARHCHLGQDRHAKARFDKAKGGGKVLDFVEAIQSDALSGERVVQQHAIATVPAHGDQPGLFEI